MRQRRRGREAGASNLSARLRKVGTRVHPSSATADSWRSADHCTVLDSMFLGAQFKCSLARHAPVVRHLVEALRAVATVERRESLRWGSRMMSGDWPPLSEVSIGAAPKRHHGSHRVAFQSRSEGLRSRVVPRWQPRRAMDCLTRGRPSPRGPMRQGRRPRSRLGRGGRDSTRPAPVAIHRTEAGRRRKRSGWRGRVGA